MTDAEVIRQALLMLWERAYHLEECPAYGENGDCDCGWGDLMRERERRGIE